jgi:hypothetical protein
MQVPSTIFVANNSGREASTTNNNNDNTNNNNNDDQDNAAMARHDGNSSSLLGSDMTTTTTTTTNSLVPSYNYYCAANNLTRKRGLQYNDRINPDQQPRPVDDVWRDIVRLLQEPFREDERSNPFDAAETAALEPNSLAYPQALKNVVKGEYESEQQFSRRLFRVLRDCLAEHDLLDDDAPNHLLIVSKHVRCNGYAMGIARETNGADKFHANERAASAPSVGDDDDDHHEDKRNNTSAFAPSANDKQLPSTDSAQEGTSYSNKKQKTAATLADDNSTEDEGGVLMVDATNTMLDHCACLLSREDETSWRVKECLSAIKLNLRTTPPRCAPFPANNASGFTLANRFLDFAR